MQKRLSQRRILKGMRPRVCPEAGQGSTALARSQVGSEEGGQGPGEDQLDLMGYISATVSKGERGEKAPRQTAPHRTKPGALPGAQGPVVHGRRRAYALGAGAPSAAHREPVSDPWCLAEGRGLLEPRLELESSRRPLSPRPQRSSPEPPASSPA